MDDRYGINSSEMDLLGTSSGISGQFIFFMKKCNTARQHFAAYNEMMAYEMAAKCRIDVPDWFVGRDGGEISFFSRFLRGEKVSLQAILNWDHGCLCRLAAFNLFVMNEDLGVTATGESHFRNCNHTLYEIDFGGALLGHSVEVWSQRLEQWRSDCPRVLDNNPFSAVRDAAAFEASAKQIPVLLLEQDIIHIVEKARLFGLDPAIAKSLKEYLLLRRENFVEYSRACQKQYPKLNISPAQT